MKRTITFWVFLALTASSAAQTPTVVEKPTANATAPSVKPDAKASATSTKLSTQSGKPSPANVKVSVANAQKPTSPAVKPAVVAVQPVPAKVVTVSTAKPSNPTSAKLAAVSANKAVPGAVKVASVPAAKTNSGSQEKVVAFPAQKNSTAAATKALATPAVKAKTNSAAQPMVTAKPMPVTGHPVVAAPVAHTVVAAKVGAAVVKRSGATAAQAAKSPFATANKKSAQPSVAKAEPAAIKSVGAVVAVKDNKIVTEKKPEPRKIDAAGRRDPFISPVVNLGAVGSGCSSGKRCLTIDQVALRGVVKSDTGMIAVVVNAMDKAYFLRENDPVFNGYVEKITGDSIVFKETFHDKLGKPLTRDVTKTISRPVA